MKNGGLTEKHMLNKHFRKTEYIILVAYYRLRDCPSAKKLARAAKISRSTLYRHHKKVQNIPYDYETYLLAIYNKAIRSYFNKNNFTFKGFYFRTLVFISNHKEAFIFLFFEGHKDIIKRMLYYLKPKITANPHLSRNGFDKIFNVYSNEILGIIEHWEQYQFTITKLNEILSDALSLTEGVSSRLSASLRIR